jgi:hypothetical protein
MEMYGKEVEEDPKMAAHQLFATICRFLELNDAQTVMLRYILLGTLSSPGTLKTLQEALKEDGAKQAGQSVVSAESTVPIAGA